MLALILACAPKPAAPTTTASADQTASTDVAAGIQDFVNRTEPKIIDCYMGTLQDPALADDSVQLQFVIDGTGTVTRVVARESSITDVRFMGCVDDVMDAEKVVNESGNTLAITRDYNFRPASATSK